MNVYLLACINFEKFIRISFHLLYQLHFLLSPFFTLFLLFPLFSQAFLWWITPQRLVFYFFLRIVRRCFVPFMRLGLVIIIKNTIIGKFVPLNAAEKERPWNRFRYWLMSKVSTVFHFITA